MARASFTVSGAVAAASRAEGPGAVSTGIGRDRTAALLARPIHHCRLESPFAAVGQALGAVLGVAAGSGGASLWRVLRAETERAGLAARRHHGDATGPAVHGRAPLRAIMVSRIAISVSMRHRNPAATVRRIFRRRAISASHPGRSRLYSRNARPHERSQNSLTCPGPRAGAIGDPHHSQVSESLVCKRNGSTGCRAVGAFPSGMAPLPNPCATSTA